MASFRLSRSWLPNWPPESQGSGQPDEASQDTLPSDRCYSNIEPMGLRTCGGRNELPTLSLPTNE